MKNLLLTPFLGLFVIFYSCESEKQKRTKDLANVGCELIETYKMLQKDPENEEVYFRFLHQKGLIESGLNEGHGITLADVKEAMEDQCDHADLLKEAIFSDQDQNP